MTGGGANSAGSEGWILFLWKDIADHYPNYKSHRTQINSLVVGDGILDIHGE
jgi:hypothetical protein